jgi:hypothetical protein
MDLATCTCYIVMSLASQHIDPQGMNQRNPGIGIEANGYAVGEYRNSLDRTSVYAGKMLSAGHFGVLAGAVSGYQFRQFHVVPLISPYATYSVGRFGVNLALVPSPIKWNETAVAVQVKWSIGK